MWTKTKQVIDRKIISHFRGAHNPQGELALASAVGLFWALTPLVGLQMTLVFLNWLLFRFIRLPFHLPIALAWVWISNPLTLGPFYYAFYIIGYWFINLVGQPLEFPSFDYFRSIYDKAQDLPPWEGIIYWGEFMLYNLGWPSLVGGFVIGSLAAIVGYLLTARLVDSYRRHKANGMGLTLKEWERRFLIKKRDENLEAVE